MQQQKSIYIPRVLARHSEQYIIEFMYYQEFGNVSRVDLIPVNKKRGFKEDFGKDANGNEIMSAFVHFDEIFNKDDDIWYLLENGESYKLGVSADEYWILLKNKNPVKTTKMNIHQVVENCLELELKVENLENKIAELTEENIKTQKNLSIIIANILQLTFDDKLKDHIKNFDCNNQSYIK